MKHRVFHSHDLFARIADYAGRLDASVVALQDAYAWMVMQDLVFEEPDPDGKGQRVYIAFVDVEDRIERPLARRLYATLRNEVNAAFMPASPLNARAWLIGARRVWEHLYNMVVCKVPIHTLRVLWLLIGGARIGWGSTVWRNTEVIGIEGLRMGRDSCIGWRCHVDARGGLNIGDHVNIGPLAVITSVASEDQASEPWLVGTPVTIGDYASIGPRCTLLAGAEIGEGAVLKAHTVVEKSVQPYTVVAGHRAEMVGIREQGLKYKVRGRRLAHLLH